jgi:hypothetical protein
MDRQRVRVIVYAWGKPYVDRLLNYAVACSLRQAICQLWLSSLIVLW